MAAMDLSKMGTAKVVLNTSDCNQIVIEKWPVSDVEWAFYLYAATELNQAGIATPTLLSADATLRKLRLEYIPYKVDQTAVANDYAIAMLGRLHRYPANSEWLYHTYTWTETALENALMLLALPEKMPGSFDDFSRIVMRYSPAKAWFQATAMQATGEEEKAVI